MLALCGHPFSAYSRKAPIGLHALALYCDFRVLDAEHPEHGMFVATQAGPQGQFPVLVDGARVAFEATCVVEYLDLHYPGPAALIPRDPGAARKVRMLDRGFDLAVMNVMPGAVAEYLFKSEPRSEWYSPNRSQRDPDAREVAEIHRTADSRFPV